MNIALNYTFLVVHRGQTHHQKDDSIYFVDLSNLPNGVQIPFDFHNAGPDAISVQAYGGNPVVIQHLPAGQFVTAALTNLRYSVTVQPNDASVRCAGVLIRPKV